CDRGACGAGAIGRVDIYDNVGGNDGGVCDGVVHARGRIDLIVDGDVEVVIVGDVVRVVGIGDRDGRPNDNLLGYYTDAVGMTSEAWQATSAELVFAPSSAGTSYIYEDVRNVTWGASGTVADGFCGPAPAAAGYVLFGLAGAGTVVVNVQTGCAKTAHVSGAVSVATGGAMYAIDVAALAGGNTSAAADVSAVAWQQFAPSGTGTWALSDVELVSDLNACGVSGYTLISA
ncbi:hypothetical protein HK405_001679, partial [Cladochytrium tenue]